jgi:hypothetical protein
MSGFYIPLIIEKKQKNSFFAKFVNYCDIAKQSSHAYRMDARPKLTTCHTNTTTNAWTACIANAYAQVNEEPISLM